jgi:putrescine aminotransferase
MSSVGHRHVRDIFLSKLKSTIKPYTLDLTLDTCIKDLMLALEFVDTDIGFHVAQGLCREKILCVGTLVNAKIIPIEPSLTITLEQVDNVINTLGSVKRNSK